MSTWCSAKRPLRLGGLALIFAACSGAESANSPTPGAGGATTISSSSGAGGFADGAGGGGGLGAGGDTGQGGVGGLGGAGGASSTSSSDGASASSGSSSSSASSSYSSSSSVSSSSSNSSSSSSSSGAGGAEPCVPDAPPSVHIPATLSATGLYSDIGAKVVAADVEEYSPRFPLWSDGAVKTRWIHLPACSVIDSSDMDHWSFPVGTKLWKQFEYNGRLVETRYIVRTGAGASGYLFISYQWNAEGTEAYPVPSGVVDANGTPLDIPAEWECTTCHNHLPERIIGFDAVQLSHSGPGLNVEALVRSNRLSVPFGGYQPPGDATAQAALGYLHGNCGHCHNESPSGVSFSPPFALRLGVEELSVGQTGAVRTAVGVPMQVFRHPGITHRIAAGAPDKSCVAYRMGQRGNADQMPALGSEVVDPSGLAAVRAWIASLSAQ